MRKLIVFLATTVTISGITSGCSKTAEKNVQTQTSVNQTTNTSTTSDTSNTSTNTNTPTTQAPGQNRVDIEKLPDTMVICHVGADEVTVGDYRRLFKLQQMQIQQAITNSQAARDSVLAQAKKIGVTLTPEEKARLLETAKKNQGSEDKFKQFLAERKITEADFDNEVESLGLAIKTSNAILQQTLLNDLVNRAVLVSAAKSNGMEKQATDTVLDITKKPNYQAFVTASGMSADQLHDELIKDELAKLMINKIQKSTKISQKDIDEFYKQNRQSFKHNERLRMSQIIISDPSKDSPQVPSLRTQVQKANPKLSGANLDAAVTYAEAHQRNLAEQILQRAIKGENFAQLANQYSDDSQTRISKTGGDLGWQEKPQLIPQLANVIWPLKSGQVYPRLIKTELGYHVIKVVSHEPAGIASENDVQDLLKFYVAQQKSDKTVFDWLQSKRDALKVTLSPEFASILGSKVSTKRG